MTEKPFRPFMRALRHLTALLLIVTLPVYAWAALGLLQFCPMQSVPMAEMADAGDACCDPEAPADRDHGQPDRAHPCKSGQECKTGSLYDPQLPRLGESLVAADSVITAPEAPILSRDPAGFWRPPRSL